MNGVRERDERRSVGASGVAVGPSTSAGATEQPHEPVMFIDEVAQALGTSVRTIQRQLRAGTFFIPELPRIDHTRRWSRVRVYAAIAEETRASHAARLRQGLTSVPRKLRRQSA